MVNMWMVCLWLMELLVHTNTSGHLLVALTLDTIVFRNHWKPYQCPCDNGNTTYPSPPFVGNDYFCESILPHSSYQQISYPNAPLWDGQVCEGGGTCCKFNNPPWFTKNLANSTTDDIELRLCLTFGSSSSNIALEQLELYVQWTLAPVITLLLFKNLLSI